MSAKINQLKEQVPLYINGALQDEERNTFEHALQRNWELKQEYSEFHEIESVFDNINDQHFDQLFARIQANVKFEPASTQPVLPLSPQSTEEESTVIMRREDGIDKARSKHGKTTSAPEQKTKPVTDGISQAKTASEDIPQSTTHQDNDAAQHEHDDEHISLFSKEYIVDFFTSARFAWGLAIAQFILIGTLLFTAAGKNITAIGSDGRPIADVATINVVFADNATQKDIRDLLGSVDAQIANGPTSIGLYTIYVKGNQNDAKNVINRLKKSTLILLAEPAFI